MNKDEIQRIKERCKQYSAEAESIKPLIEHKKAAQAICRYADKLREALETAPKETIDALPEGLRKKLGPSNAEKDVAEIEAEGEPLDALNKNLLEEIHAMAPSEFIRDLQDMKRYLVDVDFVSVPVRKPGAQQDYFSDCLLMWMETKAGPGKEYKSVRAAIYDLASEFGLSPQALYSKAKRRQQGADNS